MDLWRCSTCDYIYDPRYGDPPHEIAPGTSYLILPRGWACPMCGADREEFEIEEPVLAAVAKDNAIDRQHGYFAGV